MKEKIESVFIIYDVHTDHREYYVEVLVSNFPAFLTYEDAQNFLDAFNKTVQWGNTDYKIKEITIYNRD